MTDTLREALIRIETMASNVERLAHNDAGECLRRIISEARGALAADAPEGPWEVIVSDDSGYGEWWDVKCKAEQASEWSHCTMFGSARKEDAIAVRNALNGLAKGEPT